MFRQFWAAVFLFAACMPSGQTQVNTATQLIETIGGERPIVLQSLKIEGNISGGLAETTVRMTFYNPNDRVLEGNLQFLLLEGQQITAFALDMNGKLRRAVPVEKAKGRQVFEEVERRGVDPGLLENTQGNNFKLRVYPIAAKGIRTVELRYSESLKRQNSNWTYTLPLAFGNDLKDFELSLKTNGNDKAPVVLGSFGDLTFRRNAKRFEALVTKTDFSPSGTLTLQIPASDKARTYTQNFDGQRYFLAEIPVSGADQHRALASVLGLLWDSSGSGVNRNHDAELSLLDRYFRRAGNIEVRLTRLRDRAEATESFRIQNGNWSALKTALENTVYDGATALSDWQVEQDVGEYLMFSDGLGNYGNASFPALGRMQRLFTINSAVSADTVRLASLAERAGGRFISLQPQTLDQASRALLSDGVHLVGVDGEGLADLEFSSRDPQDGLLRVSGRMLNPNAKLIVTLSQNGKLGTLNLPVDNQAAEHPLAANLWATYRLRSLDADHELNRAAIRRIGEHFGLPTRETSLIVLDTVADYVRYNIAPPEELREEYGKLIATRDTGRKSGRDAHLSQIVAMFEEKYAWLNQRFPVKKRPEEKQVSTDQITVTGASIRGVEEEGAQPVQVLTRSDIERTGLSDPAVVLNNITASDGSGLSTTDAAADTPERIEDITVTGAKIRRSTSSGGNGVADFTRRRNPPAPGLYAPPPVQSGSPGILTTTGIALKKWTSDAPYIKRMKAADSGTIYAIYLDEKPGYLNSSAFFLDAADMLLEKNRRDLALRVLSNLAEMDLENRQILRILGYRLMQAGAPELAIPVFEKVQRLAEEEPQSFRDLGLAYAAVHQDQKAIEQLYEVVLRPWDSRFVRIELIALAELNSIIATSKQKLDTGIMDARLLKNIPLDLRVILTWDADNSDMDLWVTDPSGEKCFYGHKFTDQGGRMSDDFTRGYGPEEFSLRQAKPGKYKVQANFYGNRQQVVAGATTLQVYLTTGFGTPAARQQSVTLRLKEAKDTVLVGEFEVGP